ncbi:Aldehyde dehydrogenase [Prochlorococcus marinus str. MIT 1313]|nr:Aldehyde dehydrogenase [Prochlorococcus marinus str. MIT 1313]
MLPENFLLSELRNPVISGLTRPEAWRRQQLKQIEALIEKHQEEVLDALATDLGKPPTEALFELIALRGELKLAQRQLSRWMQARHVQVPLAHQPGQAEVILDPWNYPFSLTLQPLISALAAAIQQCSNLPSMHLPPLN